MRVSSDHVLQEMSARYTALGQSSGSNVRARPGLAGLGPHNESGPLTGVQGLLEIKDTHRPRVLQ